MNISPVSRRWLVLALFAILGFGIWLRLPDEAARQRKGNDEGLYERYVKQLDEVGVLEWPKLVERYTTEQRKASEVFLPPTRVLFLSMSYGIQKLTGVPPLEAIRWVSFAAAAATLILTALWLWKSFGPAESLGVTALLACSPLLIHLAHRALIDGFFAFWATVGFVALYECLRKPRPAATAMYGASLVAIVLTKENAAFVTAAFFVMLATNRWTRLGEVRKSLWLTTFVAPAIGGAILILAAGGIHPLIDAFRANVEKAVLTPYAINTGDGPWHRYLLDFLLINPVVTGLSVVAISAANLASPLKRYSVLFVLISYALMAQVRYGMNMRYAVMWELPLCLSALSLMLALALKIPQRWRTPASFTAVAFICALELQTYGLLFANGNVYDPVAGSLTQPLQMYKPASLR